MCSNAQKGYTIMCYAFLGMACIFMPFEGETVIKTCSDAITPAGPPICSSSNYKYVITVPITFHDIICISALICHVDSQCWSGNRDYTEKCNCCSASANL